MQKSTAGISYSAAEERTVERINDASKRAHDAREEIGKLVDGLVAVKGGVKYGEKTLDRLSKHPALMCSREHLRRCWQYHRLMAQHGKNLKKAAPSLSYSHAYQLSRLLDIEGEAIQRDAVLAMATKALDDHMTVTELAQAVSTHLASIGKTVVGKTAAAKTKAARAEADEEDGMALKVLLDTTETVVMAAEKIVAAEAVGHVAELRPAVNRLGFAYVQLVGRLVVGDEDALADARKVMVALAAAIDKVAMKGGDNNVSA